MDDAERGIWKALQRASNLVTVIGFCGATGAAGLAWTAALVWEHASQATVVMPPAQVPDEPSGSAKDAVQEDKVSESPPDQGKTVDLRPGQENIGSTDGTKSEMPESKQDIQGPIVAKDESGETQFTLPGQQGWVFAGSYLTHEYYTGPYFRGPYTFGMKFGWNTKYLDFDPSIKPFKLKGKILSSINQSNLRNDHPTSRGNAPIIGFVDSKAKLVVRDVYVADRGKEVWLKVDVSGPGFQNQRLVTQSSP